MSNNIDYSKIYEDSEREVKQLEAKKAVLVEKIKERSKELGIAPKKELVEQLLADTKHKQEVEEKSLTEIIEKLDALTEKTTVVAENEFE